MGSLCVLKPKDFSFSLGKQMLKHIYCILFMFASYEAKGLNCYLKKKKKVKDGHVVELCVNFNSICISAYVME
jgi:hypothetical protein